MLKNVYFFGLFLLIGFSSFGCMSDITGSEPNVDLNDEEKAKMIQQLMEEELKDFPELPGSLLTIRAGNFLWSGAAGKFGEGNRKLVPTDVFRSASITKTFTAAAILLLMEQGKFTLDTPIDKVLKPATVQILKDGGYKPNIILVRHLLEHTAGMYDYTQSAKFNKIIFNQPTYRWTREEQLKLAMSEGKVLGPPGSLYEYGDTQYILLGEILELQTNMDLAKALRTVLRFDALGLKDSWMETLEKEPSGGFARLSHPMYGTVDTRNWDPSWDLFGAGGLVSSTQDLVKFMDALFSGKIFKNKSTLDIMINIPQVSIGGFGGLDGGMGINRTTIAGNVCYAGYGFFGTEMIRCPSIDVTLTRTTNQSENSSKYDSDVLNAKILKLFIK